MSSSQLVGCDELGVPGNHPEISVWNIAREGAWERYKLESDKYSEAIIEVVENKDVTIEEDMKMSLRTKASFMAGSSRFSSPGNRLLNVIEND